MRAQTLTILHSFTAFPNYTNSDGATPYAGLILSGNTLYGTASAGGINGAGTVFAVNTDGTGFTILHNFTGGVDGSVPEAGLILSGNTLYGTTYSGGNSSNSGAGTVFAVDIDGTHFTTIHSFASGGSSFPEAGLILSANTLYGTTSGRDIGPGTVFAVDIDGTHFRTLHGFTVVSSSDPYTNSDGATPRGGLILSGNTLYGTASQGGSGGTGTVFALNTDGTSFAVLHNFTVQPGTANSANTDGVHPVAGLMLLGNTLYGTASQGGSGGLGTVFAVNTDGTSFTILHNFTGLPGPSAVNPVGGGSDGADADSGLILSGSTLYGTTTHGGGGGYGTVFGVPNSGTNSTILYNFPATSYNINGYGSVPSAALILSGNALYGTTTTGGSGGAGTVFSLSLGPSSALAFTINPLSQTVGAGQNATFTAAASGSPTPTYQWTFNGANITGATSATLTLANAQLSNAGTYVCIATNSVSSVSSSSATLTVDVALPGAPTGVSVVAGNGQATVSFTAPSNSGGVALSGYTVTATPSSGSPVTVTGTSSPIIVTGLTNGTAYTLTVAATNSVGTGSASSSSEAVIPTILYTFTTLAGLAGSPGSIGGTGSAARFNFPYGVAVDSASNVYVADSYNHTIRKITTGGVVTTLAGLAGAAGSADGTGSAARFYTPVGVAVDNAGNVYVADYSNSTIRKITSSGVVTTLAGLAGSFGSANGTGSAARFDHPYGVAVDSGSNVYVADTGNDTIRKIASGGVVTTLAGLAGSSGSADGTGSAARFGLPWGVAADTSGTLYVADASNETVRKITSGGVVTTLAGTVGNRNSADGTGSAARFNDPNGVAVDSAGNVYVTDALNETVRKITTDGVVTTLAGMAGTSGSSDGTGSVARFNGPNGVAVDSSGNLYVADLFNDTIRCGAAGRPIFTVNPQSETIANGQTVVFNAVATGLPTPTYQWKLNDAPISGATDAILQVSNTTSANAGSYVCVATNAGGSTTSASANLAVIVTPNPGYLVNISARANVGTLNNILIGGFAVSGLRAKQLLIRGGGPGLYNTFGLTGELVTPQLVLLDNNGAIVATNVGWANTPAPGASTASESPTTASATIMSTVGAFAYSVGSADSSMVLTMPPGNNTAQVSGSGATSGIALVEIYDADVGLPAARLVNISARANVGTANNILIGGFAIGGSTAETVLIRAVGPGLTDTFGLTGTLAQPVLTLLNNSGAVIYTNTVWGGDATVASVFPAVGAFGLNAAHQDSVLLVTLPPGNYTAQVGGLNEGTGIALCEIYEVR